MEIHTDLELQDPTIDLAVKAMKTSDDQTLAGKTKAKEMQDRASALAAAKGAKGGRSRGGAASGTGVGTAEEQSQLIEVKVDSGAAAASPKSPSPVKTLPSGRVLDKARSGRGLGAGRGRGVPTAPLGGRGGDRACRL